jgi:hypothetical protein
VVRVCLDLGVEPIFIPPNEPWRNGFIENLNGLVQRLVLSKEKFDSFKALLSGIERFEQTVNSTHRLAALDGKTPDEFIVGHEIRPMPGDYDGHRRKLKLEKGFVHGTEISVDKGEPLCQDPTESGPTLAFFGKVGVKRGRVASQARGRKNLSLKGRYFKSGRGLDSIFSITRAGAAGCSGCSTE